MKKIITLASFLILISNCKTNPTSDMATAGSTTKNKHVYAPDTSVENRLNIPYRTLDSSKKITTFGFGSCNDQNEAQPLWSKISNKNFDLFLMMGDNVYASRKETKPIINQYVKLNENIDYKKLRETTPFLATWDDHDYGQNDGGDTNPEKDEARKVYLNYWSYLKTTLPKNQKAFYHSRIVGSKKERVQFIILDTRWDRSALVKNPDYNPDDKTITGPPKIYLPTTDTKTQMLGDDQWQWLENELKKPAELRILISSIQMIANDHYFEKWGNFPHERERFFKLLQKTKIKNLIILSGDRHLSAIAKYDNQKNGLIYEITSSGLNKPSRATEPEIDTAYTSPSFLKINYGQATVDWTKKTVQFDIVDIEDKVQLSQSVKF